MTYIDQILRSVKGLLDHWEAEGKIDSNHRELYRFLLAEKDKSSIKDTIRVNFDPLIFRLEDLVKSVKFEEDPHLVGQVPTVNEIRVGANYQGFVEKVNEKYRVCLGNSRIGVVVNDDVANQNQVQKIRILNRKNIEKYEIKVLASQKYIVRGTERVKIDQKYPKRVKRYIVD
jgi:hypothetical protein